MRALAAVAIVMGLASSAAAESYRDLVEAYLAGDRGAIERVGQRSESDLRDQIKWLRQMRQCAACGERELADRFPFLGAALLHTERAFEEADPERSDAARAHLHLAETLLGLGSSVSHNALDGICC